MAAFRSDNEAPVAPEIMAALARANAGTVESYGEDSITRALPSKFQALFETEVSVFPVITGTAANALSLAQAAPPYGAIYCTDQAHILLDECGAPGFYSGGAVVVPLPTADGKLTAAALGAALADTGAHGDHNSAPAAVSLSQASEAGTVYRPGEIAAIADLAHRRAMTVHMDGARLANAVASLGCSPAEITWRAGVDLLSFGATKNGALAAEAVVIFRPELARAFGRRRMQGGHLLSKMRYLSAQLDAYIDDGLWLRLAARANRAARRLAEGLAPLPSVELAYPVEANELFARLPAAMIDAMAADGIAFHRWPGADGLVRLVCAYDTPDADIDALLDSARHHARARSRAARPAP